MVAAAQAAFFNDPKGEVCTAVRALPLDQSKVSAQVLVEDELLSEDLDGPCRLVIELRNARDGHPVPAQVVAHSASWAHACQQFVLFFRQHLGSSFSLGGNVRSPCAKHQRISFTAR
ncbi:hypothetical protein FQZ97_1058650 [compost metagenome]